MYEDDVFIVSATYNILIGRSRLTSETAFSRHNTRIIRDSVWTEDWQTIKYWLKHLFKF